MARSARLTDEMSNSLHRHIIRFSIALVVFALGFYATYHGLVKMPSVSVAWKNQSGFSYQPSLVANDGAELTLIYIGSSGCAFSNEEGLPQRIDRIKVLLQDKAAARGRAFVTIGIANDWSVKNGLSHLSKFGEFDEVMTGRSWANEGIMKYVWDGSYGEPATPQIIVIDRFLTVTSSENLRYEIFDEELVVRKAGVDAIQRWLEMGTPLPTLRTVHERKGPDLP